MIRSRPIAMAVVGLVTALAGSPGAIAAPRCQQWDVSGKWQFVQSGERYGYFDVRQNGDLLQGKAVSHYLHKPDAIELVRDFDGVINGSAIEITVYWTSDSVGVYRGEINASGRVEGMTFDKLAPKQRAAWYSSQRMKCLTTANTPPPLPAQPQPPEKTKIKILGKKKIDEDPTRCAQGFVWRVARPDDLVCVTPEARARTAEENRRAASRRDPKGAYGPHSCIVGYVWREAFDGDVVCVTPETRALAREENRLAASRRIDR